jgi:hypothetical protein
MKHTIACVEFRAVNGGGKLVGFAKVRLAELKMVISQVPIWKHDGSYSASPPAVPMFKDGAPIKDSSGKNRYQVIVSFDSPEVQAAFAERVVAAVKAYDPRALP